MNSVSRQTLSALDSVTSTQTMRGLFQKTAWRAAQTSSMPVQKNGSHYAHKKRTILGNIETVFREPKIDLGSVLDKKTFVDTLFPALQKIDPSNEIGIIEYNFANKQWTYTTQLIQITNRTVWP